MGAVDQRVDGYFGSLQKLLDHHRTSGVAKLALLHDLADGGGGLELGGGVALIVTGLARSGTSMLAAVLRRAGVFMGEQLYETVDEDAQMLAVLRSGPAPLEPLGRVIAP